MEKIILENCCRTCLQESQPKHEMKLLSSKWKNSTLSFADMLLGIIKINQEITSDKTCLKICSTCESDLITAHNFKNVCQNTENILFNQIDETKVKSEITPENDPIEIGKKVNYNDSKENYLEKESFKGKKVKKPGARDKATKEYNKKVSRRSDSILNDKIKCTKNPEKPKLKITDKLTSIKEKKTRKPRLYCRKCDITFEKEKQYMRHCEDLHWESCLCTICGKLFLECRIKNHMISHSKNRDYDCTICGTKFLYDHNLRVHMRIHTSEKRYKCDFCDESFIHYNTRQNHVYAKHTNEKRFECYICHKRFVRNASMKTHIRCRHTGDLQHLCPFCQKRFATPYRLKRHFQSHRELSPEELAPHIEFLQRRTDSKS